MKKVLFLISSFILTLAFCACECDTTKEMEQTEYLSRGGVTWKTHLKTDNGKVRFDFDITSNSIDSLHYGALKQDSVLIDSVRILPYRKTLSYNLSKDNTFDFKLTFNNDSTYLLMNRFTINGYGEDAMFYVSSPWLAVIKINL